MSGSGQGGGGGRRMWFTLGQDLTQITPPSQIPDWGWGGGGVWKELVFGRRC